MRAVKRIFLLTLCVLMCTLCFFSCGNVPYDYDLGDYITVMNDLTQISVSDAEIKEARDKAILDFIDSKAVNVKETQVGIRAGHIVKLSFKCYSLNGDGGEITALSDNSCTLIVGNGKYPDGLENALLRKIEGESFDIVVELPMSFTADSLAGQKIRYVGTVNEVYKVQKPEYNDELIKAGTEFQTVAEYEEYLYERMKEELIFAKILESSTVISYPVDELQSYTDSFARYYTEQANALGISLEEYVNKKFFISITEFYLKEDAYCKELVKKELVLYSLARAYEIDVSDAEYAVGAEKYAKKYGFESASKLEAKFGSANVRQTLLMDKVLEHISSQIEITGLPDETPDA